MVSRELTTSRSPGDKYKILRARFLSSSTFSWRGGAGQHHSLTHKVPKKSLFHTQGEKKSSHHHPDPLANHNHRRDLDHHHHLVYHHLDQLQNHADLFFFSLSSAGRPTSLPNGDATKLREERLERHFVHLYDRVSRSSTNSGS